MLRTLTELRRCTLGALDGEIGRVEDVYVDDESWTVRYVVVDTTPWRPGGVVLISPASLKEAGHEPERLLANLRRAQVQDAPPIDTDHDRELPPTCGRWSPGSRRLRRHVGEPDDVAWAIVYLASDEAKFVTGSELVADGGYTAK